MKTRWVTKNDLAEVVAIEAVTFGAWDEHDFRRHLDDGRVIGVVVVGDKGAVTGFAVYRVSEQTMTVMNLVCLDPESRRALLADLRTRSYTYRRQLIW